MANSSGPGQTPASIPASQAAPRAVVSWTTGRSTGAPRMSARNCIVQSLAVSHRIRHTPVAPLVVIAGGLLLRFVIVYAGQLSRWTPA